MPPNRVCPSGTWARVWLTMSDDVFLLPTVFLACSSTVFLHTFIPSNALIMCLLWWRDYVWWCLQPTRSKSAYAWFITLGCVTVTDQNITQRHYMRSKGYLFQNVYSLVRLVRPNTEELISRPLEGLLKIRLLFQDGMRSPEFRN